MFTVIRYSLRSSRGAGDYDGFFIRYDGQQW